MRMQMRRFTRVTNAFSKKIENHADLVALIDARELARLQDKRRTMLAAE